MSEITVVRLYLLEGSRKHRRPLCEEIFHRLHNDHRVRGVTQFRAVAGSGSHGAVDCMDLVHINAHLPVVIEFFDSTEVANEALEWIRELVPPEQIVSWKIGLG